jgi:hypothetical protein
MEHECGWKEAGPDSEKSEVTDRLNKQGIYLPEKITPLSLIDC